jgi:hypothetical protein
MGEGLVSMKAGGPANGELLPNTKPCYKSHSPARANKLGFSTRKLSSGSTHPTVPIKSITQMK